ncbi:GH92 family glycosyl hydrolase [Lentzea sp. JNUCC 0626]|uniref:GH92 family glycosyl hydrolase n=1 Tax=Lentzea sp. JNUCC 0626 TaxID=3367513 RepID=UPI003747B413
MRKVRSKAYLVMLAVVPVITALVPAVAPAVAGEHQDLARWVNPFVGTRPGGEDHGTGGGAGNTFPGAVSPFGMVQWSPDTVKAQHGGYFYDDTALKGFSLTHLSGAGCSTYGDIPFIPYSGEVTTSPAADPARYTSKFSHANEHATPGRYEVALDSGVKVELATTARTGSGRFTYPAGVASTLLVNTSGSVMGTDDASVTIGADSISGWATSGRFCGASNSYRVYFTAKFDRPFASVGTWKNGAVTPNRTAETGGAQAKIANRGGDETARSRSASIEPDATTVSGPGSGGYVTFANLTGAAVNVQVGLSFVSVEGAEANLKAENAGRPFESVAAAAREAWNARLNQIAVDGGSEADRTTFYTALYHSLIQPNLFSDVDGRYPGFDGRIHQTENGHAAYTNFSGWDVYRSQIQLLATIAPKEMSDIVRSMTDFAEQGGSWDRWTVANDYTGVMNGDPYHIIVSTAYAFGARDFDVRKALLLMVKGATQPTSGYVERPGNEAYQRLGYVPGAGADTLEYASADFSIAQLAKRIGDGETHRAFMKRAQSWQNLYNPRSGHLQPRGADGGFAAAYDPADTAGWVEGNGAQYDWMVPHNLDGLIAAFGGNRAAESKLDTFFTKLNAGMEEPYAFMGNEPNANAPWIYAYAGAPAKTQAVVRRVMTELYNPRPEGLIGNDDLGQMSSWYVWAALGMYPQTPGRAEVVLGSPLFPKTVLTTGAGKKITVTGKGTGQYVSGLSVNGVDSPRPWLPESLFSEGATVDFALSTTPTTWGSAPADAPPSFRDREKPAVAFLDPELVIAAAGTTASASVGVQDLSGVGRDWTFQTTGVDGITVTPASGTLSVAAGSKAATRVSVTLPPGTADGRRRVPVTLSAPGVPSAQAVLTVLVAPSGSWLAAANNDGVSPDGQPSSADFDDFGWSYSAEALAEAGAAPGRTITVDGLQHTWPSSAADEPDNVIAAGQTLTVSGSGQLAFLGAASGGNASGTVTITYTDGTTSTASVGFSDWTLSGGRAQPAFGNRIVLSTPYRNWSSGERQQVRTLVFASAPIALAEGKTVSSVTLPSSTSGGTMHLFAVTAG